MNKSSRSLLFVLLALIFFAIGFVSFQLYQAHRVAVIQAGPVPVLPKTAQ
jgi:hypothetical protein